MNPDKVQILCAHLQTSLVAGSGTVAPEAVARAASALAEVGTALRLPMTFAVVPGRGDLLPGLAAHATAATTFACHAATPFLDAATTAALGAGGRRTLVGTGFATEVVVLHACLDAMRAGYAVHLPVDAIGGLTERTEAAAIRRVERAGGVVTSVHSLASELAPDFARSSGAAILAVMQSLRPA